MFKIEELLKDTNYSRDIFTIEEEKKVINNIIEKTVKNQKKLYVRCLIRNKEILAKPEEIVRQLLLVRLIDGYGYPESNIKVEYPVYFGKQVKRADIMIMERNNPTTPYIVIEVKKTKLKEGKEQLKSYCNATGAPIAVWSNGEEKKIYHRKDPNYFEEITKLPSYNEKLADIFSIKVYYEDLKKIDKIANQKISLKNLIKEIEDEVLAGAGVDSFEEIFKLMFTKLYDEWVCANDKSSYLKFRNSGETDNDLKDKIQDLFDRAKNKWDGIFDEDSKITLTPSHLAVCVWDHYKI